MKLDLILPTNGNRSQGFGDSPAMYADPKYGGIKGHNGVDFGTNHGWPIYAAHDGMAYYEYDGNQGEGVVIRTNKPFEYNGEQVYFKTIYWHLCNAVNEPEFTSPIYKKVGYKPGQSGISNVGTPVETGDIIGYADNTGASTGDHLHWGLKPQAQNEENGAWYNWEQQNGYLGAIDPMPYCNGYTPERFLELKNKVTLLQTLVGLWVQLKQKLMTPQHEDKLPGSFTTE